MTKKIKPMTAGEIEAERADMGEGIGDVYYAQGLARAADIARAGR